MVDGSTTLLREALKPFARYAEGLAADLATSVHLKDSDVAMIYGHGVDAPRITYGDIRRASAALQCQPTGETDDEIEVHDGQWKPQKISCRALAEWIADQATSDRVGLIQRIAEAIEADRKATVSRVLAAPPPSPDRLSAEDGDTLAYIRGFVSEKAKSESSLVKKLRRFLEMYDRLSRQPEASEPVAWRWRAPGASLWIYDPAPEWLAEHRHEIETEPLYASPVLPDREAWQPIESAPISDEQISMVWTAAMTAACNIIIQRQNDLNDDDGPIDIMNEQGAIATEIKKYLPPDQDYLSELRAMLDAASNAGAPR